MQTKYQRVLRGHIHFFLAGILLLPGLTGEVFASARDDAFIAARDAFRVGDAARLATQAKRLEGSVLAPYASYWQLQMRLEQATSEEVRQFMELNSDSPLSDRLRGDWLKLLGKRQNWALFLSEYPALAAPDMENVCYALQARLDQQGDAPDSDSVAQDAKRIWFSSTDLPVSCNPLFEHMATARLLSVDDVWARLRLLLEAGNVSVARYVAQYLPASLGAGFSALDSAAENPQRFLDKQNFNLKTRAGRELVMFALHRIARTQLQQAFNYWEALRGNFSEEERGYMWGQLAYQAARQLDPVALNWFAQAGAAPLSDVQLSWKARAALRAHDWQQVLASIVAMSEAEQRQSVWRYWKARALMADGKVTEANTILAPLAREHNFYGQLATEELGSVIANPDAVYQPGEDDIKAIMNLPGIQRALALYQLNQRVDANREWLWATRTFDDRQLLTAAEIARRNDWIDRAINTADKTTQLHDFSLRFPAPHRDVMLGFTRPLQLDDAWVYGLIRQESRFVQQAKSNVGASGMMQLMPATASWVAKKMGLKDYRHVLVSELNTNLALGTYYLKHVLDRLDGQPVLATAAYNAGPGRARRWQDGKPLEGAIYAESIPFNETRDYVKKVMSNASYYANRFGEKIISLKNRLGTIGRKSGKQDNGDEDGN